MTMEIDDIIVAGPDGAMPPSEGEPDRFPSPNLSDSLTLDNPALQETDVAPIVYNRDGTVRQKRGRKPGTKNGEGKAAVPAKAVKTKNQVEAERMTSEQTARLLVGNITNVLIGAIGNEWDFGSQKEADTMIAVTSAYLEAKGNQGLSVDAMMMLTLAGYALPRAQHPNTREKLGSFFGGAWAAVKRIFGRK